MTIAIICIYIHNSNSHRTSHFSVILITMERYRFVIVLHSKEIYIQTTRLTWKSNQSFIRLKFQYANVLCIEWTEMQKRRTAMCESYFKCVNYCEKKTTTIATAEIIKLKHHILRVKLSRTFRSVRVCLAL